MAGRGFCRHHIDVAIIGLVGVDEVVLISTRGWGGGCRISILDWVEVGVIRLISLDRVVDVLVVLTAGAGLST